MYCIGIDLAKFKHTTTAIGSEKGWLVRSFEFANDQKGFASPLKKLASVGASCEDSAAILCVLSCLLSTKLVEGRRQ